MKQAYVTGANLAATLNRANLLGSYRLILAQEVLRQPKEWHALSQAWPEGITILDNGAFERPEGPLPLIDLLNAAKIIQPTYLVLPDVILDAKATIEQTSKDIDQIFHLIQTDEYRELDHLKLLLIAQGLEPKEVERTARAFAGLVDAYGISRFLEGPWKAGRKEATRRVAELGKPIHLFGWTRNPFDDFCCAGTVEGVMGIDSAAPTRLGLAGITLPYHPLKRFDRPGREITASGYFDETTITHEVRVNIARVEEWLAEGLLLPPM